MERNGILAGGNFIVDHVKLIDAWPEQDALASITSQNSSNGGGPYNILRDLSGMGADHPLAAIGLVGDDANGDWIMDDCRSHGIDPGGLASSPDLPTSYTDVMTVQSTGRRTFFHQRGANAKLDLPHFDFGSFNHKIFHLGYFMLLDTLDEIDADGRTKASRVLEAARAAGLQTCADSVSVTSPLFARTVLPSLPHLDYFVLNELEAAQITGLPLVEDGKPNLEVFPAAAAKLLEFGVGKLAVIHCKDASVAATREGNVFTQGSVKLPAEQLIGAVGAGDAFAAGLLHALHEDWETPKALELAACVAASCLLHETTSGGILPLADCLALGERHGYRESAS